jgi:AcrR family transcriptional regulator
MRELADRGGVTLKTLYDIYGSKDDLLIAAVRERVNSVFTEREHAQGLEGVPRLFYYVDLHSNGIRSTPAFSRAVAPLLAGPVDRFGARELYLRLHGRAFDDIRAAGELRPGADPVRLIEALMITMLGTLLVWAREQISSDELFALNRLTAAQTVLPVVTGASASAATAVIDAFYAAR